ncbi:MAG: hypothetical protein RLZZ227_1987 [Pseudomonadota bacterium]|jgi:ElaB/YqjD/DUF883 family membrane-anchored ribosome-binding protein
MNNTTDSVDDLSRDTREEFEIAKQAVLEAYSNFLEAKKHLKRAALAAGIDFKESATEQLEDALGRARDKKDELTESTSDYVKENPITSATIAFLGGVIFSRMFGK